ncbi:MAG: hypothetical protein OXF74_14085 [Rhodobacteraceae bacterium]|nr:hypothetical protein [Paracoccaceae bacterium]
MWLYTKHGFVSMVRHRDKPDTLIIRARRERHLRDIVINPLSESDERPAIQHTPEGDYPWRCEVSVSCAADLVREIVHEIFYDNFKNACHRTHPDDHDYQTTLRHTWSTAVRELGAGRAYAHSGRSDAS